jgi:CelD/BcsL family acetyltransferase involved in cellulose biosynthesis
MKLGIITSQEDLMSIEKGWRNLSANSSRHGIHQSYDWFMASYRCFHQRDRLYVLTLNDNAGELTGVAPLVIGSGTCHGIGVRRIGFAMNSQSPANDFILSEGAEEDCLKSFLEHLSGFHEWELVHLQKISAEEPTWYLLQKLLPERNLAFGTRDNIQSPYIRMDMDWNDFWKSRSHRFRKTMRNKLNRVMHENMVIEKIPVSSAKTPELDDVLRISANSWKHEIGNDLSARKDKWRFYREICDHLGPQGLIYLWLLKIDSVSVAFEFHIQHNRIVYPIRADYDKNFKDVSPGSILEYEIIKRLFADGTVYEYNTCGHTYDYLMNWTETTRKHQDLEIFDHNFKMSMLFSLEYKILDTLRDCKAFMAK